MTNPAEGMEDAAREFAESQKMFQDMWTDFSSRMMGAGASFNPQEAPQDAAKRMRSVFIKAWTEYCDEMMRSPQFLKSVKESMNRATEFRIQMNELLGGIHHDMGGTSRQDADAMMVAVRHVEKRMVDATEGLVERFEALNKRLDQLETKLPKGSSAPKEKPAARTPKAKPTARKPTSKATPKKTAKKKSTGRRSS